MAVTIEHLETLFYSGVRWEELTQEEQDTFNEYIRARASAETRDSN